MKFHYAKRLPAQPMVGFSCFNKAGEWCGVIVYNKGIGAIESPLGLPRGAACELVRVALNGKQEQTSAYVATSLRILKKENPLLEAVVSYADTDEGHTGTIYQASNWTYVSTHRTGDKFIDPRTGKDVHSRSHSVSGVNTQFGTRKRVLKTSDLLRIKKGPKHKYVYPFSKRMKLWCAENGKPYPKKPQAQEV